MTLVVLLATACAGDADEAVEGAPTIVATTSVWADVVSGVACDEDVEVSTLIPPGGDAHGFEPSLADRAAMEDAVLVVANGVLEEGLDDTLAAVDDGGTPVFTMIDHVDTIPSAGHEHDSDGEDHDDEGEEGDDPHVWYDPVRVSAALPALAETLVESADLDRASVEGCLQSYQAALAETDAMVTEILAELPPERRLLVTIHDSLGYFADRYGFEVAGTVIPASSSLAETSPAHLEELAALMASKGIGAIFSDGDEPSDDAEALAARLDDAQVVTLLAGSTQDSGGYQDWLTQTAQQIADGLSGRSPEG